MKNLTAVALRLITRPLAVSLLLWATASTSASTPPPEHAGDAPQRPITRHFSVPTTVSPQARKLRQAGVDAELQVFEGMWHGFHGRAELSEAKEAAREVSMFFRRGLGKHPVD